MEGVQDRHAYRNFASLVGDFAFFSIGLAFYDPIVVVPAFVKELTGSGLMVGVLSAVRVLMVTLPQMWAASVLVARPCKKPLLVWSSIGGRLPVLLLAIGTLLWAGEVPWLVVGVLGLSVACFFTSEGLNGISWPALVGKAIPARVRGRFLGLGQLLSSLGALGAGYMVRLVLGQQGWSSAARWALLFACAFIGMTLSLLCILLVHEEAEDRIPSRISVTKSLETMAGYLRQDRRLRRVVATQLVLGTAAAVFPFIVVRARDIVPGSGQMIGLFLMMQNLGGVTAALLCGQLIDHVGSWAAIRLGTVVQVAALLAVILASVMATPQVLYMVAFFLLGFVGGSSWWSFSAYLLDMATDEQRPIYLATSGILTSPTFLSSILVGGVFGAIAPEVVFALAMLLSMVAVLLAWGLSKAGGKALAPETASRSH